MNEICSYTISIDEVVVKVKNVIKTKTKTYDTNRHVFRLFLRDAYEKWMDDIDVLTKRKQNWLTTIHLSMVQIIGSDEGKEDQEEWQHENEGWV